MASFETVTTLPAGLTPGVLVPPFTASSTTVAVGPPGASGGGLTVPDIASGGGYGAGLYGIDYEGAPYAIDGTFQSALFDSLYQDLSSDAGDVVPLVTPVTVGDWTFDTISATPGFDGAMWGYMQLRLDGPATHPVKVQFNVGAGFPLTVWIPVGGSDAGIAGPILTLAATISMLRILVMGDPTETAKIAYAAIAVSRAI